MRKSIILALIAVQAVCSFLALPNYLLPESNWFSALLIFIVPIPFGLIMFIYRGKQAFWLYGLAGMALILPSTPQMMEVMDYWVAIFLIFLFVAALSFLSTAVVCLGVGACVKRFPGLVVLTIPTIITAFEFLRLVISSWVWWFPPPITMFAYPLTGLLPLIQFASVTGQAGIEFLVVFVSTVLVFFGWQFVLRRPRWRSWFGVPDVLQPVSGKPLATNVGLTVAIGILLAVLIGAGQIDAARFSKLQAESQRGFKPALLQSQFDPSSYSVWKPRVQIVALQIYQEMFDQAVAEDADLLLFTENALPMVWPERIELWDQLRPMIQKAKIPALLGVITTLEDQQSFNIWYQVDATGNIQDQYSKQYLIPFGEYLPLRGVIDIVVKSVNFVFKKAYTILKVTAIRYDNRDLSRGRQNKLLTIAQGQVVLRVCDEIMFPRYFRSSVRDGGEAILAPASSDWFKTPVYYKSRLQTAQFRAIENRRWIGYVSSMAGSVYFDALGRVHSEAPFGERSVHVRRIPFLTAKSAYVRFGDWLGWTIVLLALFFISVQSYHWVREQRLKGPTSS